jgi:hypothetical protein
LAEYGVNFRGADSGVSPLTDGANERGENGSSGTGGADITSTAAPLGGWYPQAHPGGFDVGWEQSSFAAGDNIVVRSRATTGDIRTAGTHSMGSGETADYRIDSGTGTFDIRIAAGDRNYAQNVKLELFDNTTSVTVFFDTTTGGTGDFVDATGTNHTNSANWVTNNTREQHTISTGPMRFRLGNNTAGSAGALNHISIEDVGGGSDTVTAVSTEHAHTADAVTLFQSHVFVAADPTQAHTADTAAFVQTHILVAQDASHDHTAGETNFNATQALTVADATHGHTADEATLSQTHILVGADQTQAHTADETTFTVQGGLVVADASHDHTADTATLAQTHALVAADASHSVSADNATLAQTHILAADSTTHGHTADATDFVSGVLLLVDDTAHGHSADAATLAQTHILVCADAEHGQSADDATLAQIHALVVANATHGMDSDVVDLDSFIPGPATLNTLTLDARRPGVTFDVTTGRSVSV